VAISNHSIVAEYAPKILKVKDVVANRFSLLSEVDEEDKEDVNIGLPLTKQAGRSYIAAVISTQATAVVVEKPRPLFRKKILNWADVDSDSDEE